MRHIISLDGKNYDNIMGRTYLNVLYLNVKNQLGGMQQRLNLFCIIFICLLTRASRAPDLGAE